LLGANRRLGLGFGDHLLPTLCPGKVDEHASHRNGSLNTGVVAVPHALLKTKPTNKACFIQSRLHTAAVLPTH
jgi:hypothetical protein